MKNKLGITFSTIASIIIILLIIRIESFRKRQKQMEEQYYNCLTAETQANEKNILLLEWIEIQSQLWFSDLAEFGSIIPLNKNSNVELTKHNDKLVYWFCNSRACSDCVAIDIENIKCIADSLGDEDIMIISDFANEKARRVFESKYSLFNHCFQFEPGKTANHLIAKTTLVRLFFVVNEYNQIMYPTYLDTRFKSLDNCLQSPIDYLLLKHNNDK